MRGIVCRLLACSAALILGGVLPQRAAAQNPSRIENSINYLERIIGGHRDGVRAIALMPDGKRFVSGSNDNTAKLWDFSSRKLLHTFEGHTGAVRCIAVSSDGKRIATGSDDRSVIVWDVESGKVISHLEGDSSAVVGVAFLPHDQLSSAGGGLRVWDIDTEKTIRKAATEGTPVRAAYSADGARVAVLDAMTVPGVVSLWDAVTCKRVKLMPGAYENVTAVGLSPDGNTVIYHDENGWVFADTQHDAPKRLDSGFAMDSITFSPDGRRVVVSAGSFAEVWTLDPLKRVANLGSPQISWVHGVAFAADGHHVLAGIGGAEAPTWHASPPNGIAVFDLDRRKTAVRQGAPAGELSWDVIPAKVKRPDGTLVGLAEYLGDNLHIGIQIAKAEKDWDVLWTPFEVFVHRQPGVLESLIKRPDDDIRDVRWDGKYLWVASTKTGLYAFTKEGKLVARTDEESHFPFWVNGITSIMPVAPGKIFLAGEGSDEEKQPPYGWAVVATVPTNSAHLTVQFVINEKAGQVPLGWAFKYNPNFRAFQLYNAFYWRDEIWIRYMRTPQSGAPVVRVNPKTMAATLYNYKRNGQPMTRLDSNAFLPIHVYEDGRILAGQEGYVMLTPGPDSVIDTPPQQIMGYIPANERGGHGPIIDLGDHVDYQGRTWIRFDVATHAAYVIGPGLQAGGKPIYHDVSYGVSALFGLCGVSTYDGAFYKISDDPAHPLSNRPIDPGNE
jgi:hypothetical protein